MQVYKFPNAEWKDFVDLNFISEHYQSVEKLKDALKDSEVKTAYTCHCIFESYTDEELAKQTNWLWPFAFQINQESL